MTVTEKTLELNITHELLTNADVLWHGFNFAAATLRVVSASHRFSRIRPLVSMSPPFAVGLTLRDEERRGWDVKLELPINGQGPHRALFIQFKNAKLRQYSTKKKSCFHGHPAAKDVHCAFTINNNSQRDQHVVLGALAGNPTYRDSVMYAFPRIPSTGAFLAWAGRLSHLTSFLRVREIDSLAAAANVRIAVGTTHDVAISFDGMRRELRSEPISLADLPDKGAVLVADVYAIRLYDTLREWGEVFRSNWNRHNSLQVDWTALFDTYLLSVGSHFGLQAETISQHVPGFRLFPEDEISLRESARQLSSLIETTFPSDDLNDQHGESRSQLLATISERGRSVIEKIGHLREVFSKADKPWFDQQVEKPISRCLVDVEPGTIHLVGYGEPAFRTVQSISYTLV